jgi:serine protease Do
VNIRILSLTALGVVGVVRVAVAQVPSGESPLIAYGGTVTDALVPAGDTLADGSYYRQFLLVGNGGDVLSISLLSGDFNASVLLLDAIDNVIASDDNGGGDCNSHLNTTLPATGRYFIIARGSARYEIGNFALSVQEGESPPASSRPCRAFSGPQGILQRGDTVRGSIGMADQLLPNDSTRYQVWVLAPALGRTLSMDLLSSEFDATLFLVRGLSQVVAANDDGGGGCNARLVFTPDEDRPYRLVTRAAPGGAVGSFVLTVSDGAKPVLEESTCAPPGS